MIEVPVKNLQGEVISTAELDERVWDIRPNRAVLHQAVVAQQANARRGTSSTLTRGKVPGSGKKHHRQKGTGMARQGDIRAPHWRKGGVVFGPHPRDWHQDLPKKMRRLAMRSALSAKIDDAAILLVDGWSLSEIKTRVMAQSLERLEARGGTVVVLPERDEQVERVGANLPNVRVVTPNTLNLLDVLKANHLIFTPAAAAAMTEKLLSPVRPRKTASRVVGRVKSAQAADEDAARPSARPESSAPRADDEEAG
jgi:large subunit ribosomal protein L4